MARNHLILKISSSFLLALARSDGNTVNPSRKEERSASLRLADLDKVLPSRAADLSATGDVEERSSEKYFEQSVVHYLDLEVKRCLSNVYGAILDQSKR